MKIWQKYLLRHLTFTFAFILSSIFAIYVLIDLSIHGVRFLTRGPEATILDLLLYYLSHFAMHLDLFLPLALLLSTYKVLFSLGGHLELVALQMAGLSRKRLLLPFFFFAAILSLCGYINHEYFSGKAFFAAGQFKTAHSKTKKKHRSSRGHLHSLVLNDQSEIVYQTFNEEKQELFDVFWIRSDQDFWHIKTLSFTTSPPTGYFADHLVRGHQLLQKQESFEEKIFDEFPLHQTIAQKPFIPFESRRLSTLFRDAATATTDIPSIKTHLHHKLALPLLPLLLLFAAAPFGFTFSRKTPIFLIVSLSLFGFIICFTLFDSLLILGENKVLSPVCAMWFCPLIIASFSLRRFIKL